MSMTDVMLGTAILVVGVEDREDGGVDMYLNARHLNESYPVYGEDAEKLKKLWGSHIRVFISEDGKSMSGW